jgi:NarL family two-component system response regulator LiaR
MNQEVSDMHEHISVLVVEDHPMFQEALLGHLETRRDRFEILGGVASGEEALAFVKELVPDIVLLDLALPEATEQGLQVLQEIGEASPATKVVVLTQFREDNAVFRAIRAGAAAYLLKDHVRGKDVIDTILRVWAGERPIDPEIGQKLWSLVQHPPAALTGYMPLEQLTERELDVLRLIADGKSNQQIAEELVIAVNTVKKHVSNILAKLQLQNRIELAMLYRAECNGQDAAPASATPS